MADAVLNFFDRNGKAGERFRVSIERGGWDTFKKEMEEAYHG